MSQPIVCGIDPGLNGAFAFLDTTDNTLCVVDMPTFPHNGKRHVDPAGVAAILHKHMPDHVFVEQVHSSPQMGVTSSFSFGRSSGIVLGALAAFRTDVNTAEVQPQIWKKALGATSDKKQTVARATQLMPACAPAWKLVKHTDRAEAALIALYGAVKLGFKVENLTLKED